jgi:hypothetical protein
MNPRFRNVLTILLISASFTQVARADDSARGIAGLFQRVHDAIFGPPTCPQRRPAAAHEEASQIAPTRYKNCVEKMPSSFASFHTGECQTAKVAAGPACLKFQEKFEAKLIQKLNPEIAQRYQTALEVNDNGDSQACIRYTNGVMKRPKVAFIDRTKELSPFLKATAAYYGISPLEIVCAVGGDATTTVKTYPNQNSYANPMVQKDPVETARAEMKTKYHNSFATPPAPSSKLKASAEEVETIRNVALILRHGHEAYRAQGFTEKDLPAEVDVSIYHLGVYRGADHLNSAIEKKKSNTKPGLSFLGLSCLTNGAIYRRALGSKP